MAIFSKKQVKLVGFTLGKFFSPKSKQNIVGFTLGKTVFSKRFPIWFPKKVTKIVGKNHWFGGWKT